MKQFLLLSLFSVFLLAGCQPFTSKNTSMNDQANSSLEEKMMADKPAEDEGMMAVSDNSMEMMKKVAYMYQGSLSDVTGGQASGVAQATFEDGTYSLSVSFEELPAPEENFFYEGWVVRKDPFHFISTGQLEMVDGEYTNMYMSSDDLTDHATYILTIEPTNDGPGGIGPDPAPAAHVLEGTMTKL